MKMVVTNIDDESPKWKMLRGDDESLIQADLFGFEANCKIREGGVQQSNALWIIILNSNTVIIVIPQKDVISEGAGSASHLNSLVC